MDTVSKRSNKDIVIPTTLRIKGYDGNFVAPTYYQIDKYMMSGAKNGMKVFSKEESEKYYFLEGIVTEINFPVYFNSKMNNTLYSNEVFANRILQFQSEWISDKVKLQGDEWVQNEISIDGIKYLETIKPLMQNGQVNEFIYTLSSLQPITKVTDVMSDYYIYIIAFVLILSLVVCLYYSRIITKPLLKINEATKKIMQFQISR